MARDAYPQLVVAATQLFVSLWEKLELTENDPRPDASASARGRCVEVTLNIRRLALDLHHDIGCKKECCRCVSRTDCKELVQAEMGFINRKNKLRSGFERRTGSL